MHDVNVQGVAGINAAEVASNLGALTQEGTPCAILILEEDPIHAVGRVRIYHAPSLCPTLVDREPHEWMGRAFISQGDVLNKETAIYELPATYCHLARQGSATRCFEPDIIDGALEDDAALEIFPAIMDPDEPHTEAVRVRTTCMIPARIAARFIESSFSPREAWLRIGGMIRQDTPAIRAACAPVIRWLQFILTKHANAQDASPAKLNRLLPQVGRPLREHRCKINFRFLPSLDEGGYVRREAELLTTQVGKVAAQLQQQREDHRDVAEFKQQPKTPGKKWPEVIQNIKNILQVRDELELRQVWTRLANCKKEDARIMLEGSLEQVCKELPAVYDQMKMIVTPAFATLVLNVRFRMNSQEDLDTGWQFFVLGQASPEASTRASANGLLYDKAQSINANLNMADVTALTSLLQKDQVPMSHPEGLRMIKRTYVTYGDLCGPNHVIVQELQVFIFKYQEASENFLSEYTPVTKGYTKALLPCLIVRWLQVHLGVWLDKQWSSEAPIAAPKFEDLFDKIKLRMNWEIPMPAKYESALEGFGRYPTPAVPRGGPPEPPPNPALPGGGTDTTGTMIDNPNHDAAPFAAFNEIRTATGGRISAKKARGHAHDVVPENMCVAWHVVGKCNSSCNRASDHREHTATQTAKLVAWCTANWHA
jgi:hypothetical protein